MIVRDPLEISKYPHDSNVSSEFGNCIDNLDLFPKTKETIRVITLNLEPRPVARKNSSLDLEVAPIRQEDPGLVNPSFPMIPSMYHSLQIIAKKRIGRIKIE